MKKPDQFESAKRQLKRGKRDAATLKKRFDTFLKKVRHTQVIEPNADGSEQLVKLKFSKRIPASWDETAYTAIDALRSALDQTGYAAAVASGKVNPKHTQFPIGDDAAGMENVIVGYRACRDIPDDVVALFRSFQPYKGGNDAIWSLNKLRRSFHTTITPVAMATGGIHMRSMRLSGGKFFTPRFDTEKNEIVLASLEPGGQFQYDGDIAFTVTFDEIDFLKGAPVFGVLGAMATEVERVLMATEAECRRLGFIP